MGDKETLSVNLTDRMVLFGFGLAFVYLFLDTFLSLFLPSGPNLLEQMIGFSLGSVWERIIIFCLFAIFGSHAQYTINKRLMAEEVIKADAVTRERFQRLLSPDLAELVVSGQLKVEKGGQDRVATVMFVDIRGFTSMSENMNAAAVLRMLNDYFEMVVESVFLYGGTVDKFIGDSIMVIWGAPIKHENDALQAVRAALDIQCKLVEFNRGRGELSQPRIEVGIGIKTGKLVAGYIGSSHTMSYSVIGDTVNTASRICSAAKPGQILVSERTYEIIRDDIKVNKLEKVQVKGKAEPVQVYEIECLCCEI